MTSKLTTKSLTASSDVIHRGICGSDNQSNNLVITCTSEETVLDTPVYGGVTLNNYPLTIYIPQGFSLVVAVRGATMSLTFAPV